ncbi:MAG TPA: hypothetical protein VJR27_01280 [Candidatus Saccharimonadales bacterium]|nr:hypothetical protein [Candidatus Saccharimonadales bacterium]
MKQSRLLLTLLQPSILSFVCTSLFAAAALLGSSWSYLKTQPFFTTYFSGDYGLHTLVSDVNATIGSTLNKILSYNIIVVCFAVLIGLIVFAILQSVHHMHIEMSEAIDDIKYASYQNKSALEKSLEVRVGLRVVTALAWLGYSLFFFNALIPLCATLVTKHYGSVVGPISNLLAFTVLLVATHFHVIFARLLVLRPRLFGVVEALEGRGH